MREKFPRRCNRCRTQTGRRPITSSPISLQPSSPAATVWKLRHSRSRPHLRTISCVLQPWRHTPSSDHAVLQVVARAAAVEEEERPPTEELHRRKHRSQVGRGKSWSREQVARAVPSPLLRSVTSRRSSMQKCSSPAGTRSWSTPTHPALHTKRSRQRVFRCGTVRSEGLGQQPAVSEAGPVLQSIVVLLQPSAANFSNRRAEQ